MKMIRTRFNKTSKIYAFTTENISGYFPLIDFSQKKILTVCSSGDHMINAYLMGADYVMNFDINRNAQCFAELKIVAIQRLSFTEFCSFFFRGKAALSKHIYDSVKHELSKYAQDFFNELYCLHDGGNDIRESDVFSSKVHDIEEHKKIYNIYLDEEKYLSTKHIIKNRIIRNGPPEFMSMPLSKIADIKQKFDIILLSNIADYSEEFYPGSGHAEKFSKNLIFPLRKILKKNGEIVAAYLYGAVGKKNRNKFNEKAIRRKVFNFPDMIYTEHKFRGTVSKKDVQDMIIVLKKKGCKSTPL